MTLDPAIAARLKRNADGLFTAGRADYGQLEQLLAQMIPLAAKRGGGMTWEYYFEFDGGQPPWTSAMSQATGLEALTRAFEAGCVGFLAKSRPWSDVVAAVRAASRGESVMRADELASLLNRLKSTTNDQGKWLTDRELEVLRLLAKAKPTDIIAAELFLSTHTVRNHISNILSKLGAHSKLEAVATAVREGILEYPT